MAKVTVTDAEVQKILRRVLNEKTGKTSAKELKKLAQRYNLTRPKGQGKGKGALQNLARQIAVHEKTHRARSFRRPTPEQKKIIEEHRRQRKVKLKGFGKGLGKTAVALGKKIPYYHAVRALEQFSDEDVIPVLGAGRESTFEGFQKRGVRLPWSDKRVLTRDIAFDPESDAAGWKIPLLEEEVTPTITQAVKGPLDPVGAMSSFYQAGPRVVEGLGDIIGQAGEAAPSAAQLKFLAEADTNDDGKISAEERAVALKEHAERPPTLGASALVAMQKGRRAAADAEYLKDVPADLRPTGRDKWFYGGAGDAEFKDKEEEAIFGHFRTQRGSELLPKMEEMLREQHEGTRFERKAEENLGTRATVSRSSYTKERGEPAIKYEPETDEFFNSDDRAAFRKAALDGTLVEMFDTDGSGGLSRSEKELYFDKTVGFKAGGPVAAREAAAKAAEAADFIPAPYEGDLPVHAAGSDFDRPEYDGTVGEQNWMGEPTEPTEPTEPPPTTREYAAMMRQAIGNEAIGIEERNEVMRTIRDEMINQNLTSFEEFNQIGRQMLEEAPARKAAAHVAYLRSPAGSDWVKTPGLDSLAALQKAPFGRGTALEGSVGGLKDESRQLESTGGRLRRKARELEGMGHRSVAAQVRAAAPRRPLMSQRDRLELEKKKKALAAEQAAAQALISKGEENINANIVS